MARIEIMSGTERRPRWSDEAKLRILAEADEPGARIGDVARRHDIHPGQIRLWRQSFSYAAGRSQFTNSPRLSALTVSPQVRLDEGPEKTRSAAS